MNVPLFKLVLQSLHLGLQRFDLIVLLLEGLGLVAQVRVSRVVVAEGCHLSRGSTRTFVQLGSS